MEENASCASPREEGELEDGEIFDDEPQTRQQNARPQRRVRPGRPMRGRRARPPGPMLAVPLRPVHPPFAFEAPRSGFWERSHDALGRFRYRAARASDWTRDWTERFPENHRNDSPGRKQKPAVRGPARRPVLGGPRAEAADESFEALLLKYKQIQLELECIRKEERRALTEDEEPCPAEAPPEEPTPAAPPQTRVFQAFNIRPLRQKLLTPAQRDALNARAPQDEEPGAADQDTHAETLQPRPPDAEPDAEPQTDLSTSALGHDAPVLLAKKEDEDDLSELQLRLLALQSASRKWQQKEQQVLKESKEKISRAQDTSAAPCRTSARGTASRAQDRARATRAKTKQALRKQQLREWKLAQEQQRRQEQEEERRRREDEIRRIRDLANQDEQYNRFMRLVGARHRSQSRSADGDQRKLKQTLDTSGSLYQYDNYDEVAMETDSETGSPAASPTHDALPVFPLESTPLRQEAQECVRVCAPPLPPLPPPDEDEPPPKPPFADEEEEEEMLLREELLKSLASKRTSRAEECISGPPSPALRPAPLRSNLSSVSLNPVSVGHTRALRFPRTHPAPKAPFVLPRHKAVVVRLNASDDSDSDTEGLAPAHSVLGGLESMIREARRTAEAAKPKHPVSEKENNPMKSSEPRGAAVQVRGQRSAEAQIRGQRSAVGHMTDAVLSVASPAESDSELELMGRTAELQERCSQHRAQLSKDEALLKQLLQQELKKKESLKAAEGKAMRLKEQLLASEKIVSANRLLLRKLQEQVQRVQQRVSVKQQQALRLEQDLSTLRRSSAPAGRRSEAHYAELIAQKQRLQQLESEYALKIQKLKEAQALRQADPRPPAPPPSALFTLPQPSLHDLTQDKLALGAEAEEAEDETAPAAPARRRSFRESGSFTKPKLSHAEPGPALKAPSAETQGLPELLLGLNAQDLRHRHTRSAGVSQLLQEEAPLGPAEDHSAVLQVELDALDAPQSRSELRPVSLGPYRSPLLLFRSYRFSPYFRTKEKLSLRSLTYSHALQPRTSFCRFELTGTCNADDCAWQHMRNCSLSENQLFQDILSYCLPLIGCDDSSSSSDISAATEKYMKRLFGANKDRMGTDQKAVLLVSKVNEKLRHIPPFTTCKPQRSWRPEAQRQRSGAGDEGELEGVDVSVPAPREARGPEICASADVCVAPDDKRYFDSETDDISNLETSVLENPNHVQLWIKLAFRYLNQKDTSPAECVDAALNTLSRALEENPEHAELWSHYLTLFSRRGSRDELREMCEMAVEHAPHYDVWWSYMSVESGFEGKDFVCGRLIGHLLDASHDLSADVRSFQMLEALLFRTQLSVFSGRRGHALLTLQAALDSRSAAVLTPPHRCVLWLSLISLRVFSRLPPQLFDPVSSSPSRLVSVEPLLLPWGSSPDAHTHADALVSLFTDAVSRCADERVPPSEQIQACFPLHSNLAQLYVHLDRRAEAVSHCERVLALCPLYCPLLELCAQLRVCAAPELWSRALSLRGHSARLLLRLAQSLHAQGESGVLEEVLEAFMRSFCQSVPDHMTPLAVLRHFLGFPTEDLLRIPVLKDHLQEEMKDQLPDLHLLHCFLQSSSGSVREAVDAFEKALGAVTKLEFVHTLWLDYLSFSRRVLPLQPSVRELRSFWALVRRCLETVPWRLTRPFSCSQYWSCFSFHNQVISFYLGCLPKSQHSLVLERLQHIMPTNTELAIRAIAVEKERGQRSEVRRLFQQALQNLPLSATLWTDRLLFEAAEGAQTEALKRIIEQSQAAGVSLQEALEPRADERSRPDA